MSFNFFSTTKFKLFFNDFINDYEMFYSYSILLNLSFKGSIFNPRLFLTINQIRVLLFDLYNFLKRTNIKKCVGCSNFLTFF